MKIKRLTALLAAILLVCSVPACARTQDEAPDPSDMVWHPSEDGADTDGDGLYEFGDTDVPLGETPDGSDFSRQVIELLNAEREAQSLGTLKTLDALDQAAALRAQELITSFSHTRPDGSKYRTALESLGIDAGHTGENAAMGYPAPADAVQGWMNSEGHRANMLRPEFTHAGAGFAVDPATGWTYWILLFTSDPIE